MSFAPLQNDTFLRACLRQSTGHTPVWLMRQAGRYLPEYCATRARAGSFMGLATNVDYATEVTLQPLERYALDAAILFSDILTVPDAMGLGLTFQQGEGPKFAKTVRTEADVATLALAGDTDALHTNGGWIPRDWQKRLPHNSSPYTSTIVLVVRAGNPKNIRDWDDLIRPDVKVITPNPKTSGGARWNYLAAWEFALRKYGGPNRDVSKAQEFVKKLYENVPVLDAGARGASISFARRNQGDVLLSWENEAYLLEKEFGNRVDFVYPSLSVLAEPAVTVVDKNVDRKGTRAVAEAYLQFLYTEEAQDLIGKHFYRPTSTQAQAKYARQFPKINLFRMEDAFGGWTQATRLHFADGGSFDQIYSRAK